MGTTDLFWSCPGAKGIYSAYGFSLSANVMFAKHGQIGVELRGTLCNTFLSSIHCEIGSSWVKHSHHFLFVPRLAIFYLTWERLLMIGRPGLD